MMIFPRPEGKLGLARDADFWTMTPRSPAYLQPVSGAVAMTYTRWVELFSTTIGRVTQSRILHTVRVRQPAPGLKVARITCGSDFLVDTSLRLVLSTAYTRPVRSDCKDLMLRWSSAMAGLFTATPLVQVASRAPSRWTDQ